MSQPRRHRLPAPPFLVGEHDQVLIQMAGFATLELRGGETTRIRLVPGRSVSIRAGTPARLVPESENVVVRFASGSSTREVVTWYCDACGAMVHQRTLESPGAYWSAVRDFNADAVVRTCGCGAVHRVVDLADLAWASVACALSGE